MLERLRQREAEGRARYKGLAAAWHIVRIDYGVVFVLFALAVSLALYYLTANFGLRFPLDDGYLNLTFARNLLRLHHFTYDGTASGLGSASPVQVALIALLTTVLRRPEFAALILGIAAYGITGIFSYYWAKAVFGRRRIAGLSSLLTVTSGWLIFDALSGTETMLFIMFLMLAFWLIEENQYWFGIPLGFAVLTQPDGLFFVAGVLIYATIRFAQGIAAHLPADSPRGYRLLLGILLALAILLPVLLVNLRFAGSVLPAGIFRRAYFYGEVALPLVASAPILASAVRYFYSGIVGFIPGVLVIGLLFSRKFYRSYYLLFSALFLYGAYLLLFPSGLLTGWCRHQHIFIPVAMLAVAEGIWETMELLPAGSRRRIVSAVLVAAIITGQIVGLVRGRWFYARAVQSFRQTSEELIRFLYRQTKPDALVASCEIGALGYFARRPVLDLSGTVNAGAAQLYRNAETGRVIPFRKRQTLDYLLSQKPQYLIMHEQWRSRVNFDPDTLPAHFTALGETKPIFPARTGGYKLYRVR